MNNGDEHAYTTTLLCLKAGGTVDGANGWFLKAAGADGQGAARIELFYHADYPSVAGYAFTLDGLREAVSDLIDYAWK